MVGRRAAAPLPAAQRGHRQPVGHISFIPGDGLRKAPCSAPRMKPLGLKPPTARLCLYFTHCSRTVPAAGGEIAASFRDDRSREHRATLPGRTAAGEAGPSH